MTKPHPLYESLINCLNNAGLKRLNGPNEPNGDTHDCPIIIDHWYLPDDWVHPDGYQTVLGAVSSFICNMKVFRHSVSKNYYGQVRVVSETYDNYIMVIYQELPHGRYRTIFQSLNGNAPAYKNTRI